MKIDKHYENIMMFSNKLKAQREFWTNKLSGEFELSAFPANSLETGHENGGECKFVFSEELHKRITAISGGSELGIYVILLSAVNYMLYRYTGEEDLLIGIPPIRQGGEGCRFTELLVLRCNIKREVTFKELLREVKTAVNEAFKNQNFPFMKFMETVYKGQEKPFLKTVAAMRNIQECDNIYSLGANLNLLGDYNEKSMELCVQYNPKLYQQEGINQILEHISRFLEKTLAEPDKKITELDILSDGEKEIILELFNNTALDYEKDKTIHELFEMQTERSPDSVAVTFGTKSLTYRQLNQKANQLARLLRQKGVLPDSIVGIIVERSIEMILGIMGILKAGGAYLPIDPEYPVDRIQYMLEDSGTKILLTQKHLRDKTVFVGEVIELDDERLYEGDSSNLETINRPNDLVYVIYTSGSTGTPKGVMIEHQNVVNTLIALEKQYPVEATDSYLLKTAFTFDVSVTELFGWFIGKGRLEILPQGKEKDADVIIEYIKKRNITHINFVPSMLNIWIEELEKQKEKTDWKLKYVMAAGEALSPKSVETFYRQKICARLENLYGPTEASIYATKQSLESNNRYESIPIGKPIDNTKAYIVGKNYELQPFYMPGELCLAGAGLARGYLNRLELTAKKFVSNPFDPGTRMYRTGDLARWLPDGNIEFLGRIDHQVKIRGFRIELGEVESQLLRHTEIKEAVVIAREDKSGSKYLCAYIASRRELATAELREHLSKVLPDYMIPSFFVQMDKLPLTPNGKLDRKSLPEPDGSMVVGTEYEAARNETEEKLVKIFEQVLSVEKVGINDNFFELGGHSLRAISIAARVNKEFNIQIDVSDIFKVPTIKNLAGAIIGADEVAYTDIEPIGEREYYEASSAQKRMFALNYFDKESINYNMPMIGLIEGNLDVEKFAKVFDILVKRHESLRTSFELIGDDVIQRVHSKIKFEMPCREIIEEEIDSIISEFIRPFDLSKAPLIRLELFKLSEERHIFMFDMHHIISDGTSIQVLWSEISQVYRSNELPELKIQYKDFSEWQNKIFKSGMIKKQEEYWLNVFKGEIPKLNMPTDFIRPLVQSSEGEYVRFFIERDVYAQLTKLMSETGTTMYMVLLAVFNLLLSKYTGQEDIVVGMPIVGRRHADLDNIIGMFVNTLAIKNHPRRNKTYREFLLEVKDNALKAYENQDYQFETLISRLQIERDMSRNPLFDVMFAMENIDMPNMEVDGLKISFYKESNTVSKFDMKLSAATSGDGILLELEYCTKLYKRETIDRLIEHFLKIVDEVIKNFDVRISDIVIPARQEWYSVHLCSVGLQLLNTPADYKKSFLKDLAINIDEEMVYKLRDIAKQTNSTVCMVMLAAINILVSKLTGEEDVIIGSLVSGSNYINTCNETDPSLKILVIRNYPERKKVFRVFLDEVRESVLKAYQYNDCKLEAMLSELGIEVDLNRNLPFGVCFNYLKQDKDIKQSSNYIVAGCDITIKMYEAESTAKLCFEYVPSLFTEEAIYRFKNDLIEILCNLTKNADVYIKEITDTNSKYVRISNVKRDTGDFDF